MAVGGHWPLVSLAAARADMSPNGEKHNLSLSLLVPQLLHVLSLDSFVSRFFLVGHLPPKPACYGLIKTFTKLGSKRKGSMKNVFSSVFVPQAALLETLWCLFALTPGALTDWLGIGEHGHFPECIVREHRAGECLCLLCDVWPPFLSLRWAAHCLWFNSGLCALRCKQACSNCLSVSQTNSESSNVFPVSLALVCGLQTWPWACHYGHSHIKGIMS